MRVSESWSSGGRNHTGLEDKQLVCGPRGCVPIDVLLSDESGAYGWMDRFQCAPVLRARWTVVGPG